MRRLLFALLYFGLLGLGAVYNAGSSVPGVYRTGFTFKGEPPVSLAVFNALETVGGLVVDPSDLLRPLVTARLNFESWAGIHMSPPSYPAREDGPRDAAVNVAKWERSFSELLSAINRLGCAFDDTEMRYSRYVPRSPQAEAEFDPPLAPSGDAFGGLAAFGKEDELSTQREVSPIQRPDLLPEHAVVLDRAVDECATAVQRHDRLRQFMANATLVTLMSAVLWVFSLGKTAPKRQQLFNCLYPFGLVLALAFVVGGAGVVTAVSGSNISASLLGWALVPIALAVTGRAFLASIVWFGLALPLEQRLEPELVLPPSPSPIDPKIMALKEEVDRGTRELTAAHNRLADAKRQYNLKSQAVRRRKRC